jgi:predicted nucleic acid-binding protein
VNWFTDSSALVKRYVNEKGSKWLRHEITRHHVIIAQIAIVEVVAALRKRFRQGDISEFASYQARKRFITHVAKQQFRVIDMSSEIVDEAMRVAFDRDLRAYDAVQLSSALTTAKTVGKRKLVFITADANLEKAARAEGQKADNPLDH